MREGEKFENVMLTPFMKSVEFKRNIPPVSLKVSPGTPEEEKISGEVHYVEVLKQIHQTIKPSLYLEIGVRRGDSLFLSQCDSIGVDPDYQIKWNIPQNFHLFRKPSDAFFREDAEKVIQKPVDLAFIDGMHLFEYVLWDFMNVEAFCHPGSIIVIDDIFPNHPLQATRERKTVHWTGDVWRLVPCLQKFRPDLNLTFINTEPTGLLVVSNLNPKDETLWKAYPEIESGAEQQGNDVPEEIIQRKHGVNPKGFTVSR